MLYAQCLLCVHLMALVDLVIELRYGVCRSEGWKRGHSIRESVCLQREGSLLVYDLVTPELLLRCPARLSPGSRGS